MSTEGTVTTSEICSRVLWGDSFFHTWDRLCPSWRGLWRNFLENVDNRKIDNMMLKSLERIHHLRTLYKKPEVFELCESMEVSQSPQMHSTNALSK